VNNQSFLIRQGWDSTERTLHIIGIKWAIFAAKDIAAGPIARVLLPFRVPSGFHCNFYSADNRFYTQAITNKVSVPAQMNGAPPERLPPTSTPVRLVCFARTRCFALEKTVRE
jgi:hypothetical protein